MAAKKKIVELSPSLMDDEAPIVKMVRDDATLQFLRLRKGISTLPLEIRLRILFWWLLDHLKEFEYYEDVSTSCSC